MDEERSSVRPFRSLHTAIIGFTLLQCSFICPFLLAAQTEPNTPGWPVTMETTHTLQNLKINDGEMVSTTTKASDPIRSLSVLTILNDDMVSTSAKASDPIRTLPVLTTLNDEMVSTSAKASDPIRTLPVLTTLNDDMVSTFAKPSDHISTVPVLTTASSHCLLRVHRTENVTEGNIAWDSASNDCDSGMTWIIHVPESHGIVVDFHHVRMEGEDSLTLYAVKDDSTETLVREFLPVKASFVWLYAVWARESSMKIDLRTPDGGERLGQSSHFNLTYTAHPKAGLPSRHLSRRDMEILDNRYRYVCSGITNLPKVITCDRIVQCKDGEDEEGCVHSDEGCGAWLPSGNHCYRAIFQTVLDSFYYFGIAYPTSPSKAAEFCESEYGATLATLQEPEVMKTVVKMIRTRGFSTAVVGLHRHKPVLLNLKHLYSFMWQWGGRGGPIDYDLKGPQELDVLVDCAVLNVTRDPVFLPVSCIFPSFIPDGFICMRPNPARSQVKLTLSGLALPPASDSPSAFPTKACPDGSVVQTFHRCQWEQLDEDTDSGWSQHGFPLFQCRYGPAVHYSLLCDGKGDCADRSDEMDCQQPRFPPLLKVSFICTNWQAIPADKLCSGVGDCFDESDEDSCLYCKGKQCASKDFIDNLQKLWQSIFGIQSQFKYLEVPTFPAKVVIEINGGYTLEPVSGDCGTGLYLCQDGHCIPSFLLNNGEQDCPHGEDEHIPPSNMACPGYYRCQGSGSCVHKDYVCDGVFHCPNKDDEMFCHLYCPADAGCACEGHAFKCSAMINPLHNLHLRYLDLSHAANVSLQNVHWMEYLFLLNVSHCGLDQANLSNMPSLEILDLSSNSLTGLTSLHLYNVPSLAQLDLSHNPLMKIVGTEFTSKIHVGRFYNLKTLIMSSVGFGEIENKVLSPLSSLQHLDIRENPVRSFGKESLSGLTVLKQMYTDQSKLCCSYFHPSLSECFAPVDELSSCSDLLAQDFFRVCLWTLAVLAVVGNGGVLVYRLFVGAQKSAPASRILVTNLCASDLLMGIYMTMIGVADALFRGEYVVKENDWKDSIACTTAGFLSFVSSEVSAFVICLITLDRVLVICFPFNKHIHLSRRLAIVTCCGVWLVGFALASAPLVAGIDFYGQNGICIPLPITRQQFSGQTYAFGVFIVLNLIIFILIGVGQVLIYCAVRNASRAAGTQRPEQDMTVARRLLLIVLTDFCCWFPIGVMGLLAAQGTPIPGEVNVWAAIFVLPLNAALNPFLYTLNGLLEKWRQQKMDKATKKTLGKLQMEVPIWQSANVEELMRICVRSKLVRKETMTKIAGISDVQTTKTTDREDL